MQKKYLKKIQHLFMIKPLNKLGIKGNFLNLTKGVHKKPALTSHLTVEV